MHFSTGWKYAKNLPISRPGSPRALRPMPDPSIENLHYVLEIEPLDLGPDVKAVGLDLMEVESREPARGADAAHIWSATLPALAGNEMWSLDFFAHLDRVREYCALHAIAFEEKSSGHSLVIPG